MPKVLTNHTKLESNDDSSSIKIEADMTDDGFRSPVFRAGLPLILKTGGMSEEHWSELIIQANVGVAYRWLPICCNPCCLCCFFCNCHNKRIKTPMNKLCETWNAQTGSTALLPPGFKARYEMTTTKVLVADHRGGSGATLDIHHCLIFYKDNGAELEVMQR
jgi:hypothetical protein